MPLLKKLSLLLPWKRTERERWLEEELRSHMELAEHEALREGATAEEARFAARRDLGSTLRAQEGARRVWGFPSIEQLQRDVFYSLRLLRRAPSFTAVAVLSLGLGIGAATAIFSLVNTVLLKPLAYREPGRLVNVREIVTPLANTYPSLPVNFQHFRFWRSHTRAFESIAAVQSERAYLTSGDPIALDAAYVSANFFSLLGIQPQTGRMFLPEEEARGRDHVVVLTDSLWSRRFGRDPALIGKTIELGYQPYTVVGILPPGFRFFKNGDLGPLTSLGKNTEAFMPLVEGDSDGWGGDYDYIVFGRLKAGAGVARGAAELNILERQIEADHRFDEGLHVLCTPLQDVIASPVRTPLYVLLGAVFLLLLIVCVNLANLILARSSARTREFSIRAALGSGRARLIQQVLIETLLLGLAGGALGLGISVVAVNAFALHTRVPIPRLDEIQIDGRIYFFSLAISVGCGLFSGLLPALRIAGIDNQEALRAGSYGSAGTRQSPKMREILIGIEVAISVVLLFGAGLMTASLGRLLRLDRGFTVERALAFEVLLPYAHYKTPEQYLRFWERTLDTVRSVPGVESAAYASALPLTGESMVNGISPEGVGEARDPVTQKLIEINVRYVSPEYFSTLGVPLVKGRFLEPSDRGQAVAVISERLAAKVWPGQNPLGRKFSTGGMVDKSTAVVGVVKDVHATTLDREPTLMIYIPYWHRGLGYGNLVVRTAADPVNLIPAIRKRIREVDPSLPVPEMTTIRQVVSGSLSQRYFQASISSGFGLAALALALIGIYGVVAYNVARRRREIAIRLALGATRINVLRVMLQAGLRPVVVGLSAGLVGALFSAQLIRSLLFGIRFDDPLTMTGVIVLLAGSAFCACVLPARRAIKIEPASALRYE